MNLVIQLNHFKGLIIFSKIVQQDNHIYKYYNLSFFTAYFSCSIALTRIYETALNGNGVNRHICPFSDFSWNAFGVSLLNMTCILLCIFCGGILTSIYLFTYA